MSADTDAPDAVAAEEPGRRGRGWRAGITPARVALVAGCPVAVAALYFAYLRLSGTQPVISDGANNVLQAWQMVHGNLLLHGWVMTDVSFYTTELPEYMAVVAAAGLRPEVVHICAALTYTLLVLLAALVARGRARGAGGIVRGLLAAGIMLAPAPGDAANMLLLDPDHTGTAVPVLLLMLLLDWAPRRWYTPVAAGVLLAWALVGDSLILLIGVAPVVAVCLLRFLASLAHHRAGWYELWLACAAGLAVPAADVANRLIVSLGGFTVRKNPASLVPTSVLPGNVHWTVRSFLALFGADVAGAHGRLDVAFAIVHLAGTALVVAAIVLAAWRLVRSLAAPGRADMVADLLVVAIVANIAAYFLFYRITYVYAAHEIAPVVSLGAALAGRLFGGPLLRARLVPALAAGLVCYSVMLGFAAAGAQVPPANASVADWLVSHGLRSGVAPYWEASSITLDSGGTVTVKSLIQHGNELSPWRWEQDMRLLDAADPSANFFVTRPGDSVSPAMAQAVFGRPAHVYRYQGYTIMVWDKNVLRDLDPAYPPAAGRTAGLLP